MCEIPSKGDGFDSLVLPDGHKEIVKALVQMHSQGPNTSQIDPGRQLDLVRGKGKCYNTGVHASTQPFLPSSYLHLWFLDRVRLYAERARGRVGKRANLNASLMAAVMEANSP